MFQKACEVAEDRMTDKIEDLSTNDTGCDVASNELLQRRLANFERELAPIQEAHNRAKYLGQG